MPLSRCEEVNFEAIAYFLKLGVSFEILTDSLLELLELNNDTRKTSSRSAL